MTETGQLLEERKKRVFDAVQLKEPDRVPFMSMFTFFPARYSGLTYEELMYDYDKLYIAAKRVIVDFEPDMYSNPFGLVALGPIMERLDYRQLKWPGHGVSTNSTYQFVEAEHMRADEYDAFLSDPTDFMLRVYLPRICGALEPLKRLPSLPATYYIRIPLGAYVFGIPEVAEMLETLIKAGSEGLKMLTKAREFTREMEELGFPPMFGGTAYAPFDYLGDNFRGTRGIMLDMYRNPEKLLQAVEKILAILADSTIETARRSGTPYIFIPLHKGLDGFMSLDQFKTFFWPTLRELMIRFIDAGLIPCPLWEGDCTSRLETIKDIPKGKAIYHFERTDLFKAKEILGDTVCLRGNVSPSLLNIGTPQEVADYCKKLIEVVGKGGGFIMDGAIGVPDEAKPENVRAMVETTKTHGIY